MDNINTLMDIRESWTVCVCVVHCVCSWGDRVLHKLQSFISDLYSQWLLSVSHSSFTAEEASGSLRVLMAALWLVIANTITPTCSCLHLNFQRMILKTTFLKLSWLSRTDYSVFWLHYFLQKLLTLVSWGHFLPSVILKYLLETNSEPWTRVGEYQSCLFCIIFFFQRSIYSGQSLFILWI